MLRGLSHAAVNLPTITRLLNRDFNRAALEHRNADAVEVNRRKAKLENPRNLIKIIGIIQLLNKYSQISLTAQSATFFPS